MAKSRTSMASAFERIDLGPSSSRVITPESLIDTYRAWRLLWVRPIAQATPGCARGDSCGVRALRRMMRAVHATNGAEGEWSVENDCGAIADALDANTVVGSLANDRGNDQDSDDADDSPGGRGGGNLKKKSAGAFSALPARFYCSTVLNGEAARRVLDEAPLTTPTFLTPESGAQHGSPVWLFLGSNATRGSVSGAGRRSSAASVKRRRRVSGAHALGGVNEANEGEHVAGRTEHTDAVTCSGTWHYQVSGSKVWYLRPLDGAAAWREDASGASDPKRGSAPPELGCRSGGAGGSAVVEDSVDGSRRRRLRVPVQEGDLLLVDTSAWWHETALPPAPADACAVSASYAREFFLHDEHGDEEDARAAAERADGFTNVTGLYAPRAVKAGEVVVTEEECHDCEAGRSEEPNCELVEVEVEGKKGKKGRLLIRTVMALAAVRDIAAGEFITIAPSDDEDSDEESGEEFGEWSDGGEDDES